MNSRRAANLLLLASLLAQSSTSLSADRRHNKRRIRSTSHKDVTAENFHDLQPHNFLDNKDTVNSVPLPSARIVGGTETQPNRYPYMVSLQKVFARQTAGGTTLVFFAQKCGGTLIADGKQGGRKTHVMHSNTNMGILIHFTSSTFLKQHRHHIDRCALRGLRRSGRSGQLLRSHTNGKA